MPEIDNDLLERFERDILEGVPHVADGRIINATPLVDITKDLRECARSVYNTDIDVTVYAKSDAGLPAGSIKMRPAIQIIHDAIKSGRLRGGQVIIEATSGNFGIALGKMTELGLPVISLVSRRLQEGVFQELRDGRIGIIDMDMDICPAPGMKDAADAHAARAAAANVRSQLAGMGFDTGPFDSAIDGITDLLAKQDIINLARLLADAYGWFCPEQYDNDLNIEAHRTVTAPEIDQQLHEMGDSLERYNIACTFGTGGTSGGIDRYMRERYNASSVHVVFPVPGQDVAGIRTRANAEGLKMYAPGSYARVHEADFGRARHLLKFFVDRNHDIGESTALALYAVLTTAGAGDRFIVMAADGIAKYRRNLAAMSARRIQVSLEDAASGIEEYDRIVWVHTQYAPKEDGIDMIARALGVDKSRISIPRASTIDRLLSSHEVPEELNRELDGSKGKSLMVCMAGNTSLMVTRLLESKGITTESLSGGITSLPESAGRNPGQYIRIARG